MTTPRTDKELLARLRTRLPVCPFSPEAPKHELEASDPCPICGDYGDERSKNLCKGADTGVMGEAAARLETLIAERDALAAAVELTLAAHKAAREMVPDEEEGLAAQVFAYHINATEGPMIDALNPEQTGEK